MLKNKITTYLGMAAVVLMLGVLVASDPVFAKGKGGGGRDEERCRATGDADAQGFDVSFNFEWRARPRVDVEIEADRDSGISVAPGATPAVVIVNEVTILTCDFVDPGAGQDFVCEDRSDADHDVMVDDVITVVVGGGPARPRITMTGMCEER